MSVKNKVPAIRFKGFSGEWEEKELGTDVAEIISGGTPSTAIPEFWNGDIDWYSPTEIGSDVYAKGSLKKITNLGLKNSSAKVLPAGNTVLFTSRAGIGDMAILCKPGATNQGFQSFIVKDGFSPYFIYSFGKKIKEFALKHASGSTFLEISGKQLGYMKLFIPNQKEQTQIGNYFQKLDKLVSQHQQKHDKLSNIKKAMLKKMFPKQGETMPEIRFKGFNGEWENKSFGACFINIPNNTLSRANLNYKTGLAKNIHYGDVLIKFGEILDASNERLPFITNDNVVNKIKHAVLRDGDIIIADAAEDSTVGKCTELFNTNELLVLAGLHTIAARPILPFASKYLGYYLNSSSYHDQLLSLMQGIKVLSISKNTIQNTNIAFPTSTKEQTAIGNYFQQLDLLINQHQQQITKLSNIKQACLSKMFV